MYYTQTKLYYDIIFWPIGILRGNDVTIVLALNRISALIDLKFRNALRCAGSCFPLCEVSQVSVRGPEFEVSWNF